MSMWESSVLIGYNTVQWFMRNPVNEMGISFQNRDMRNFDQFDSLSAVTFFAIHVNNVRSHILSQESFAVSSLST